MGFEVEAATDALLACHDTITSGGDGNDSSRPLDQAIEILMMNSRTATFGGSPDSSEDEDDFMLDSDISSHSDSQSTTGHNSQYGASPPLRNQPLRLAWGSDRQRQSAAALCAAVEEALHTRSSGGALPSWASLLLAAAERGRHLAEQYSRTNSSEKMIDSPGSGSSSSSGSGVGIGSGGGSDTSHSDSAEHPRRGNDGDSSGFYQRGAMHEAALIFALADLTRPDHGVATALRRPAALQLAVVLAHEGAMARDEREAARAARQAREARNPLGVFDHSFHDDDDDYDYDGELGVSGGGGGSSAQHEAKGGDRQGRGKDKEGDHDAIAAVAWRRAEMAVHRSIVASGPSMLPSWMEKSRGAEESVVGAFRTPEASTHKNSSGETTGGGVSGGGAINDVHIQLPARPRMQHAGGVGRPLCSAEREPGELPTGTALTFHPISGFAYPIACRPDARVNFLETKQGRRAAHVMWASGFTFWVYWQDLRRADEEKVFSPSAAAASDEVSQNKLEANDRDLASAHAAVVAAARAAVAAQPTASASFSNSPNTAPGIRNNASLRNKLTNHNASNSSSGGKCATFESRAGEASRCAVCWDDLTVPLNAGSQDQMHANNVSSNNDDEDTARMLEEGRVVPLERNANEGDSKEELTSSVLAPAPAVLERSSAVPIPGCGHTLCAECIYSWLKSNISSGKLSGTAMRCPLANVSSANGGHAAPLPPMQAQRRHWGGRPNRRRRRREGGGGGFGGGFGAGDDVGRSDAFNDGTSAEAGPAGAREGGSIADAARELTPQEVETLIVLTADVGEVVHAEALAQEAARVDTARLKALKAAEDAARAAELNKAEDARLAVERKRNDAEAERAVAFAHVTCPAGHVLVGHQANELRVHCCDGVGHLASMTYGRNGKTLAREELCTLSPGCSGGSEGVEKKDSENSCVFFGCRTCNFDACSSCALALVRHSSSPRGLYLTFLACSVLLLLIDRL